VKASPWSAPAPQQQIEILGQLTNMADQQLTHGPVTMLRGHVAEGEVEHVRAEAVLQRGVRGRVHNHLKGNEGQKEH